jgi:DNA-binding MarR family transcriptional regulator
MITRAAPPGELATSLERLASLLRRLVPPRDLSLTTVSTLHTLARSGPFRLSELATREGVTQPAMTQLVSRLERDRLAERRGDPHDARVVMVHLTEAGERTIGRLRERRAQVLATLLDRLPPEDERAILAALPAIDRLTALADDSKDA